MDPQQLLADYSRGLEQLKCELRGLLPFQLDEIPVTATRSVRHVVCWLTDAEIVHANRFKRVLTEDNPTVFD